MLTITKSSYTFYSQLPKDKILVYSDLLTPDMIKKIQTHLSLRIPLLTCLASGLQGLTGSSYTINPTKKGGILVIPTSKGVFTGTNVEVELGMVIVIPGLLREDHKYQFPDKWLVLYERTPTSYMFLRTSTRRDYAKKIQKDLTSFHTYPDWEQCIHLLLSGEKELGTGCYGSVCQTSVKPQRSFAMKVCKLKEEVLSLPVFSRESSYWNELHILKMLNPLLQRGICPNLPYLYDVFTCKKTDLILKKEKVKAPCMIVMVELAQGSLRDFLSQPHTEEELYNALFQIMVAIHVIQLYLQVNNYDIKCDNILFYKVERGGYWHYRIQQTNFYLPNLGYLFILNDFGTSKWFNPLYPVFNNNPQSCFKLGHRYAVIKNGKFLPINYSKSATMDGKLEAPLKISWSNGKTSMGGLTCKNRRNQLIQGTMEFSQEIITFLKERNLYPISEQFFQHPDIIPPFEFYNDTQDGLRMFCGGKRTTQSGTHRKFDLPDQFKKRIEEYKGRGESIKDGKFSIRPEQVVAGYFVKNFFTKHNMYITIPSGKLLESYLIS